MIHKSLLVFATIAIPFSLVNFTGYLHGGQPNMLQAVSSILFVLLWGCYGFFSSRSGYKHAYLVPVIFWGAGLLLYWGCLYFDFNMITFFTVVLFPGPLYGLEIFYPTSLHSSSAVIGMTTAFTITILGFLLGLLTADPNTKA